MNPNIEIPFSRPCLGTEEERAVVAVLRSGWLTTGTQALSFEKEFAQYVNAPYALAVNSCTAGLHLALEALRPEPGGYVITTPYTFTASSAIVTYLGCHPYFADIGSDSFNISPARVEKAIERLTSKGKKIAALLPVHIGGLPCGMDAISAIATRHAIPVIEDAAHALPAFYNGKQVGTLGSAGVFSFYANKTITTGEGGMVVTHDKGLAERVALMRNHGIDRPSWDRYTNIASPWRYEVREAGFKYNMPDTAAAIGRVQLGKAGAFRRDRLRIAEHYTEGLADCDFIRLPAASGGHAWHLYLIRLVTSKLTIDRDEFIRRLSSRGIGTSVHYRPLHLMPYYQKRYGLKPQDFPAALANYQTVISLPVYPGLAAEQAGYIIQSIWEIGKRYYKR